MDVSVTQSPGMVFFESSTNSTVPMPQTRAGLFLKEVYALIISRWGKNERIDANEQPLNFLLPVLELYVNQLQAKVASRYAHFLRNRDNNDGISGFRSSWTPVRDVMVDAGLPFEAFKQYDSCYANGALQKSSKVQRLLARFHHALDTASHVEQQIRDELSLQVSHLSLEESRKSIQQSRESIRQSRIAVEESKRVKMRT